MKASLHVIQSSFDTSNNVELGCSIRNSFKLKIKEKYSDFFFFIDIQLSSFGIATTRFPFTGKVFTPLLHRNAADAKSKNCHR